MDSSSQFLKDTYDTILSKIFVYESIQLTVFGEFPAFKSSYCCCCQNIQEPLKYMDGWLIEKFWK